MSITTNSNEIASSSFSSSTDVAAPSNSIKFRLLPDDCLLEFCSFLNCSEILAFNNTHSHTKTLITNDSIWKRLCNVDLFITDKANSIDSLNRFSRSKTDLSSATWKQIYIHYIANFKRYRSVITPCFAVYDRLLRVLDKYYPAITDTFNPAVLESSILDQEAKLAGQANTNHSNPIKLPLDWLCFLRLFDGQNVESELSAKWTGLFGGFEFYSFETNFRMNSFKTSLEKAAFYQRGLRHNSLKLIPITRSEIGGSGICTFFINLQGQIVRLDRSRPGEENYHKVSNSFLEWMSDHVEKLEKKILTEGRSSWISRFAAVDPCGSSTLTRNIRIIVSVLLVPEQSQQFKWFYTYHVAIRYEGSGTMTCRLTTRHWKITDANGTVDIVDGPGVIGEYPYMYANAPQFEYESCCPIGTPQGTMEGWFTFQIENSDETFNAMINPFIFDPARNYV